MQYRIKVQNYYSSPKEFIPQFKLNFRERLSWLKYDNIIITSLLIIFGVAIVFIIIPCWINVNTSYRYEGDAESEIELMKSQKNPLKWRAQRFRPKYKYLD